MNAPEPSSQPGAAEFDSFAGNYDAELQRALVLTGEDKSYYAEGRVRWLKSCLEKLGLPMPRSCVDFGCGTGGAAPFLAEVLGIEKYVGFDPSGESVKEARRIHADTGWTFTADAGSLQQESFDLAFCNGVFHHIPPADRAGAVHVVARSLKPGGIFAFWENNPWNPMVHYLMSRVSFDRDAQMLFPRTAAKLLRAAGLSVLHRSYKFIFPASLARLRGLEGSLSGVPFGGQYQLLARKGAGQGADVTP